MDELFQVHPEGPAVDGLVSLIVMVGAIFLCYQKCGIVPDLSWAPNPWLILDGVEDLVDREPTK